VEGLPAFLQEGRELSRCSNVRDVRISVLSHTCQESEYTQEDPLSRITLRRRTGAPEASAIKRDRIHTQTMGETGGSGCASYPLKRSLSG
jgi:hypothetical protein